MNFIKIKDDPPPLYREILLKLSGGGYAVGFYNGAEILPANVRAEYEPTRFTSPPVAWRFIELDQEP